MIYTEKDVEMLVDKIASFIEREENWHVLVNAWIFNGRSETLGGLLREAIKE